MALAVHYRGARVTQASPLSGARQLTDFDVMRLDLSDKISGAKRLDISEPMSFPFEDLPSWAWTMPLTIHLPQPGSPGSTASSLVALLGSDVFSRLTVLDAVSASDDVWPQLQQRYGWPDWMRVSSGSFTTAAEIRDTEAIELKRAKHGQSPYDNFSIRTTQSKERLLAVRAIVRRSVNRATELLYRDPSIQIHGCHTSAFVPMMWSGLAGVCEHNRAGRLLLQKNYLAPPFELIDPALGPGSRHELVESADIVVGIGNLRRPSNQDIRDAFDAMFQSLRVGGALIICERLNGVYGPNDLLELLLDASNHDLVMDDMETVRVPSDETHGYAVMTFCKLGTPKR